MINFKTRLRTALFFALAFANVSYAREFVFSGQDFAPFIFEEKGETVGSVVDIMKEACKELKYTCKFEVMPSARANKSTEDGTIDGLLAISQQPDKDKYAVFASTPFFPMKKVYLAKVEDKIAATKDLKDFAGKTVVTNRGTANAKILQKHKEEVKTINAVEDVDYPTIIQRYKNAQYGPKALILGAEDVVKYYATKEGINLESVYLIDEVNYGAYFSKKKVSADEQAAFNKTLAALNANGTFKKAFDKYKSK